MLHRYWPTPGAALFPRPRRSRAAPSTSMSRRWTSRSATPPRAASGPFRSPSRTVKSRCIISRKAVRAADRRRQRDRRLRGAGAVAASGGAASFRRANSFRLPKKAGLNRRDGRMDPARRLQAKPRHGRCRWQIAVNLFAGPVHATAIWSGLVHIESCSRPGLAPRPAGARNHRGRADRGFRSRSGAAAAAEGHSAYASRWTISAAAIPR